MDIAGDTSTTTFLTPGQSLTSDLGFLGDIDVIETSLMAGLAYGFSVSTTDPALDLFLRLLNSDGSQRETATAFNGNDAGLSSTITLTDSYYIEISDGQSNDTGDYTVTINANDTILDSIATTASLAVGGTFSTFSSNIDVTGDVDVVETAVTAGLDYGLTVSTTDAAIDLAVRLLDASGGVISAQTAFNGNSATFALSASETDSIYVEVGDSGTNDTGDYTITMNANDTILNSLATTTFFGPTQTFSSSIDIRTDIDVIAISPGLTEGLTYGFTASTGSSSLDLYFLLLDSEGSILNAASAFQGADSTFTQTIISDEQLFLQVSDISADDVGAYTITIDKSDTIENTIATNTQISAGETFVSAIDVARDTDVIAIAPTLTAGLTYGFSAVTSGLALDINFQLQNATGGQIIGSSVFDGADAGFSYTVQNADQLYLQITDIGNNEAGDYTLVIDDSDTILNSTATTQSMAVSSSFASALEVNADADMIAVDLVAGERYDFTSATTDAFVDQFLQLFDAAGNSLSGNLVFEGATSAFSYTALTTDTFYLRISDSGNNDTADYQIIVTSQAGEFLIGDSAMNEIYGGLGKDVLRGFDGEDTLWGGDDGDIIQGGKNDDVLLGEDGRDRIDGGKGNDTLDGGTNHDRITGGIGDDMMTGGAGRDKFVFNTGHGDDTITDFEDGKDLIWIKSGAADFSALTIDQVGDDVVISFSDVTITLLDTTTGLLSDVDFQF